MDFWELCMRLSTEAEGSRELDQQIAIRFGWKQKREPFIDDATGEQRQRTVWVPKDSQTASNVPRYTTNFNDSLRLARSISAERPIACSWESGNASVKLGSNPVATACTPMMALCLASIQETQQP